MLPPFEPVFTPPLIDPHRESQLVQTLRYELAEANSELTEQFEAYSEADYLARHLVMELRAELQEAQQEADQCRVAGEATLAAVAETRNSLALYREDHAEQRDLVRAAWIAVSEATQVNEALTEELEASRSEMSSQQGLRRAPA